MTLATLLSIIYISYPLLQTTDQGGNQTVGGLTTQFVPIIASVLSPPGEQLSPETRQNLTELVRFLYEQDENLIRGYDNLMALCN